MIAKANTVRDAVLRTEQRIVDLEAGLIEVAPGSDEDAFTKKGLLELEYRVRDKLYEIYTEYAGGVYV